MWINVGDIIQTEDGAFHIVQYISPPNLFGQIKYELYSLDQFWNDYKQHGCGD